MVAGGQGLTFGCDTRPAQAAHFIFCRSVACSLVVGSPDPGCVLPCAQVIPTDYLPTKDTSSLVNTLTLFNQVGGKQAGRQAGRRGRRWEAGPLDMQLEAANGHAGQLASEGSP